MISRHSCALFALCVSLFSCPAGRAEVITASASQSDGEAIQAAVSAVYPALVRIHVVMEDGENGRMRKNQGFGSGTIISPEGYVLTNHHVAGRGTRFRCTLSNREEVDATLVGTDALADLAVIKLDLATRRDPSTPVPFAKFGDSSKLKVGDVVLAMGSPGGLSQSVTRGIVANTEMIAPRLMSGGIVLDGEKVGELVRWIGHDAVIYPGNSGGPLVNLGGEIIGVNEVGIASLGGAIPSHLAQQIAADLITKGAVERSWIGLEVQPLLRGMVKERGALVSSVLPGSPAEAAGIKPGDFITGYSGRPVPDCRAAEDLPVFNTMVLGTPVGAAVQIEGVHGGEPMKWKLTTAPREPNEAKESELRGWGITVRDLTRMSAIEKKRNGRKGVLVDTVRSGGPCAESKPALQRDDVITKINHTGIPNVAALFAFTTEFTKDANKPMPVVITFERGTEEFATVAKIGPEPADTKPQLADKAWLGATTQVLTPLLAEGLGVDGKKGVRVTGVLPGSPADKAGLKKGDLLLKLDGQVIAASRPEEGELLGNLIRAYDIGATVEFTGIRDGQPVKIEAQLARRPKDEIELAEFTDDLFEFTMRDLSMSRRAESELGDDVKGVSVQKVESNGWTALAGLQAGDIVLSLDGKPTENIESVKAMLLGFRDTKPRRVVLQVKRGIRNLFIEVEPKW